MYVYVKCFYKLFRSIQFLFFILNFLFLPSFPPGLIPTLTTAAAPAPAAAAVVIIVVIVVVMVVD